MENKTFGYGRVSTKDQNEARQIEAFKEFGISERDIFLDKESGKDFNREKYQLLKSMLRENDLLVIKSLDRLGRSYEETKREYEYIVKMIKADIYVIDMPILDTRQHKDLLGTFISDLIISVLTFNADQERRHIKQRQREGIDIALRTGITKTGNPIGRPRVKKPQNFDEVVAKWKNKEMTAVSAMKELNLSKPTFYKMVKQYSDLLAA